LTDDTKRFEILYNHAVNEVAITIKSQMMTPEAQSKLLSKFLEAQGRGVSWGRQCFTAKDDNAPETIDAPLLSCACCGIRTNKSDRRKYHKVDVLEIEDKLKLREGHEDDTVEESDAEEISPGGLEGPRSRSTQGYHRRLMDREPLSIPYNDEGDMKEVDLWRLRSIWPAKKPDELAEERDNLPSYMFDESGDPVYFHLHPEFVDEKVVPGEPNKYYATICSHCKKSLDENKSPWRSLVSGIDFGYANRIGLEPLTELERQIISKVRHYILMIKIESNTADGRVIERGQSKVKGCGIYFNDDSARVVSDLLSQESIYDNVYLQFVGPEGEYDALAAKVLGSANVTGRAWVIYQWLKVLGEVNCHYKYDDELPGFDDVKGRLKAANEALVENADCVNDEAVRRETEIAKDDVRKVRTRSRSRAGTNDEVNDFPFRCSLLASNKTGTDVDRQYLESAAETLRLSEESKDEWLSRREGNPLNEYENGDETFAKANPDVCLFGTAYGNSGPTLSKYQIEHLLMQFTTSAASNRPLLFQLFESDRRHSVISSMHAKHLSDPREFEKFANEFSTDEFQAKVKASIKDPDGPDAKYILNKLTPFLTSGGKKSAYGALEKNRSAGEILAMGRRFGCASNFLTFGIDDINHPNSIRLALPSSSNHDFPAVVSSASQVEMKKGITLMDEDNGSSKMPFGYTERMKLLSNNPVGAAEAYIQVVHDIMSILCGTNPSNKTSSFKSPDDVGMTGTLHASFGKNEVTHSGSLHHHAVQWGGLPPELLEAVADIPELNMIVASVLDSQFSANVDRHMHVQSLIKETISTVKGQKKLRESANAKSLGLDTSAIVTPVKDTSDFGEDTSDINSCNLEDINTNGSDNDSDVHSPDITRHDSSVPGAFAEYGKKLKRCQDTTCQREGCNEEVWIPSPFQGIKMRAIPMPIIPSKSKAKVSFIGDTNETISSSKPTPLALQLPPDPNKQGEQFKSFVGIIICHCGIHVHTFTCKKPPKGWQGCRLCYDKALNNGTRPIELRCTMQPDGTTQWDMLEKSRTEVQADGSTKIIVENHVEPYDPEVHTSKENLYPLPSGSVRTIVWELDRPKLKPLPELDDDMTKDQIISKLYNEMLPSTIAGEDTQFEEGIESISRSRVDLHQFYEHDKNNLFYGLLLGLIESSQLIPGSKSVEGLRRELMQSLREMPLDYKLGNMTVEQHIKSRMDSQAQEDDTALKFKSQRLQEAQSKREEPIDDTSIEEKVELYSQLMMNVDGDKNVDKDDCFEGGELEVYLFAEKFKVNVVVYDEEDNHLIRVDYSAASGDDRPTMHLLRTPSSAGEGFSTSQEPHINPPKYNYKLFTFKMKRILDSLGGFDLQDLKKLYGIVTKSLEGRNGKVVDFNPILTSVLGCNSNLLHLGSSEQSKAALFLHWPVH